jgi:hypothetical protein
MTENAILAGEEKGVATEAVMLHKPALARRPSFSSPARLYYFVSRRVTMIDGRWDHSAK